MASFSACIQVLVCSKRTDLFPKGRLKLIADLIYLDSSRQTGVYSSLFRYYYEFIKHGIRKASTRRWWFLAGFSVCCYKGQPTEPSVDKAVCKYILWDKTKWRTILLLDAVLFSYWIHKDSKSVRRVVVLFEKGVGMMEFLGNQQRKPKNYSTWSEIGHPVLLPNQYLYFLSSNNAHNIKNPMSEMLNLS